MDAIRVLYVEDNPADIELTRRRLARYAPHLKLTVATTLAEARDHLAAAQFDVVLADYRLPDGTGLDVLEEVKARDLLVPVVLVTGAGDAETAVRLLKAGASDYVVKRGDYLTSLPHVLEGTVEWYRAARDLRHTTARILYAEHDQGDVALTERAFRSYGSHLQLEIVSRGREALARLRADSYDLLLLDYRIPDLSGLEVLRSLRQEHIRVPVVMVTGQGDEEVAVQAFKLGASDYIVKGASYLAKLPSTVENVLARRRLEDERNALAVLNALSVTIGAVRDGRELGDMVARAARDLLKGDRSLVWLREDTGYRPIGWTGLDPFAVSSAELRLTGALEGGAGHAKRVTKDELLRAAGSSSEAALVLGELGSMLAVSLASSGRLVGVVAVGMRGPRDFGSVEERLLTALANHAAIAFENVRLYHGLGEQLEARARLTAVIEATTDLVGITDADGRILYLNRAGRELMGLGPDDQLIGLRAGDFVVEAMRERVREEVIPQLAREGSWSGELTFASRSGGDVPVWAVATAHPPGAAEFLSVIARDIRERRDLEEQLRQAHKMESIGRLAAGVAHDFNNLLTVIGGRCDLMMSQLAPGSSMSRDMGLVQGAAERAGRLTRQLLAFSRKQVLEPRVLDLNATIAGVEPLLRRTIGEDIEVVVVPAPDLGRVRSDLGQLEQVLLNLAVNARDAMPRGGRLTIETANATLDEAFVRRHPGSEAGAYAMMAVSDTGCGMDAETLARIFEPFFTTKEPGKGTGLGLSSVYGIVKQSGGYIAVESEPGRGATFRVYLPRVDEDVAEDPEVTESAASPRGSGTVLLVEDNEDVRTLTRDILELRGYTVLETQSPADALLTAERYLGPIDLIVTDMVMPQMTGREVADRIRTIRPELKVLFMSGYTDTVVANHGLLGPDTHFIQKPFTPDSLGRKVREVLASDVTG